MSTTFVAFKNGGAVDETGWSRPLGALLGSTGIGGVAMVNNSSTALQVTQHGGGANMSVDIQVGDVQIYNSNTPDYYWGWNTAVANASVTTANPSLPRIDALVVYVDESVTQNVTYNNPGALKFLCVAGTPNASPVAPNNSAILTAIGASNPYYVLANVAVGAGVTSITNANITDTRAPLSWGGDLNVTTGGAYTELQDSAGIAEDLERFRRETEPNFIASGSLWTPDSPGTTLNGSMSSGFAYINGRRVAVGAVSGHAFTASKDTYVDIQDAGNGTANVFYSAVNNNAASPALGNSGTTANTIRVAIVISGASNIAAQSSINQGTTSTPVVSSVPLLGSDSLGNIIYPHGSTSSKLLVNPYKFRVHRNAAQNTSSGSYAVVNFDTKDYDTSSNVDVTTHVGRFTAPVAGFYQFNTWVGLNTAAGTTDVQAAFYKNGAVYSYGNQFNATAAGSVGSTANDLIPLAANDYVEVYFFCNGTVALSVGANGVYFSGFLSSVS